MANTARDGKDIGLIKVGEGWGIRLDQLDETDKKLLRSLLNAGWRSGHGKEIGGSAKPHSLSRDNSDDTGVTGPTWGKSKSADDDLISEISFKTKDTDKPATLSPSSSTPTTSVTTPTTSAAAGGGTAESSTFRGSKPAGGHLRSGVSRRSRRLDEDKTQKQGSRFDRSMRVLEWLDADCGTRLTRHYEKAGGWRHTKDIMSATTPTFSASPPPSRSSGEGDKPAIGAAAAAAGPRRSRQGLFIHLPKGGILAASAAQQGHIVQHQLVAGSPRGAARPPLRLTRSHILSHTTDLWHGYVKDSEEESDSITGGGSTGSASGSVGTPKKRVKALPEIHHKNKPPVPRLSAIPRGFFAADGDTSSIGSDDSFLADDNNILFDQSDDDDDDDLVLAYRRWEEEQLAQQETLDEISMQEYVTSSEEEDDDDNDTESVRSKARDGAVNRMRFSTSATKIADEDEDSDDSSEDELVRAIRAWQEEQEKYARLQQLQQQRRSSLVHQPPPLTPVLEEEKEAVASSSNSPSWEPFGYFYRERNLLVYQVNGAGGGGRNVPAHLLHQPYWWEDISSVREGPSSPPVIAKNKRSRNPFTSDTNDGPGKSADIVAPACTVSSACSKSNQTSGTFLRPQKPSALPSPTSSTSPSKLSLLPAPANAQPSLTPSPTASLKWTPPFLNLSSTSLHAPPNSPNPVASPLLHSPMCSLASPKPGGPGRGSDARVNKLSTSHDYSPVPPDNDSLKAEMGTALKSPQPRLGGGSCSNVGVPRSPLIPPGTAFGARQGLVAPQQGTSLSPLDPSVSKLTSSGQHGHLRFHHTSPLHPASSPLISRSPGAPGFGSLTAWQAATASGGHTSPIFSAATADSLTDAVTAISTTSLSGDSSVVYDITTSASNGRRQHTDKRDNQLLTASAMSYSSFDSGIERSPIHSASTGSKSGSSGSTGSGIDKIGEFFRKVGNKLSGSGHDHHHKQQLQQQQQQHLELQHQKLTHTSSSPQVKQRHHSADNGSKVRTNVVGSWKLSFSSPSISPPGDLSQTPSPSFLKPPSSPSVSKSAKDGLSPLHSPCVATKSDPHGGGGSAHVARWQAGASWAVGSNLHDKQKQKQSRSDTHVSREEKDKLEIPNTGSIFRNLSADNIINSSKDENRENSERWRRKTDAGLGSGGLQSSSTSGSGNSFPKYIDGSTQGGTNLSPFPSSPHAHDGGQRTVSAKTRGIGNGGGGDERGGGGGREAVVSERGTDSIVSPSAHSTPGPTRGGGDRRAVGWGEGQGGRAEPSSAGSGIATDSSAGGEQTTSALGARKGKTNSQASTSTSVTGNYQNQSYHFQSKQQQQQTQQQQQQQQQQQNAYQPSKVFLACGEAQPFVVPQSYHHSQHYQQQKQVLRQCHSTGDPLQQQQHQPLQPQNSSPAPSRLFPRSNLSLSSKTSDLLIPTPKDPEPVSPKPITDEGYKTQSASGSTGLSALGNESAKSKKGFVRRYFTFDTESKSVDRENPPQKTRGVLNSGFSSDGEGGVSSNYTSSGVGVTARYTRHEEDTFMGDNKTKLKSGKSLATTASSAAASAYREALLSSRAGTSERSSSTSSDERGPKTVGAGGGGVDHNTLAIPGASSGRGDNGAGPRRSSHGTCNHLFLQQPSGSKSPLPLQQQEKQQQNTKVKKSPSPVRSQLLRAFQNNSSSLSSNSSCGYDRGGAGAVTTPPISPPPHQDNEKHHSSSSSLETSPRRCLPDLPPANYRGRRKFSDTGLTPIPRRLLTDGRRGSLTDERTLVSAKSKLGKLRHQGRKSSVAALVKQIHNLWDDDDNDDDNDDDDCYNDDDSDDERGKCKGKKKSSSRRPSGSLLCSFDDQILFDRRKKKFPLSLTGGKDKEKNKSNASINSGTNSGGGAPSVGQGSGGMNGREEATSGDRKTTKKSEHQGEGGGEAKRASGGGSGNTECGGGTGGGLLNAKIRGGNPTSDAGFVPSSLANSSVSGLSGCQPCTGTLASLSASAASCREDPDRFHYLDGSASAGTRINLNDVSSSSLCAALAGSVSNVSALSSSSGALCGGNSVSSVSAGIGVGGVVATELVGPVAQVAGRQLVATAVGSAAACLEGSDNGLLSRVGPGGIEGGGSGGILLNSGNTSASSGRDTSPQHSGHGSSSSTSNGAQGAHSKNKQHQGGKKTATVQFQPIVSWDDNTISSGKSPVFPALRSVLKQGARRHSSFAGFTESEDNLFGVSSTSPTNPDHSKPIPSSSSSAGKRGVLSHQDSLGSALSRQAKNAGLPKSKTSDVFRSILKQSERQVVAHVIDSVGGKAGAIASCSSSATSTLSSINPASQGAAAGGEKKRAKSVSPKAKKTEKASSEVTDGSVTDAYTSTSLNSKATDATNKAALSLCLKASRSLSPKHRKSRALEYGNRDSIDSTDQSCQVPPLSPYDREHLTDSGHCSLDLSSTKTVGVQVTPRTVGKTSNTGTQTSEALSGGGGVGGSDSGAEHSSSPTTGGGSSSASSAGHTSVGEGAGWLQRLANKCMASVGGGASRAGQGRGGPGSGGMCVRVGGGGGGSASAGATSSGQVGSGGGGQHPRTASVRAEWLLGSKRMGSSPSSPVAPANDASERFWVPQGVLARKRAQSLVPTLSKQESEEGESQPFYFTFCSWILDKSKTVRFLILCLLETAM